MKVPERGAFPVTVKQGSCAIKIYKTENKGYVGYKVAYYDKNGLRKTETFADYTKAYNVAKTKVENLATGNLEVLTLTDTDRLIYLRAKAASDSVHTPLDIAAQEYAEAKKLVGNDSLLDAVRIYLRSHSVVNP